MSRKRRNFDPLQASNSSKKKYITTSEDEESYDTEIIDTSLRYRNRSGKINKIMLKNFMCHNNLVMEFNKSCNLLIGNNGSGKSAILTALIVGLGSNSSATNRCTNITQLIKRGENSCKITIHILNEEDGYDHRTYGNEIIVERSFSINGSSSYQIRKSSGELISKSRKELMRIMLFLNIQVDNPVCILHQDASRSFLKESDPKKRFKFFLKATQLDTIMEKLDDCIRYAEDADVQLTYQKNLIISLKDEVEKIQKKFNSLQAIGSLKINLNEYKLELAWLNVEIKENILKDVNEKLCEYQQTHEALIDSMNNREVTEVDRTARCELLTEQINALKAEMEVDMERKAKMRKNISKDEEDKNGINRQLQQIFKKVEHIQKNIEQLENDMSESRESKRGRIALEKEANAKKLEKLIQSKSEGESIKENNARDIEMMAYTQLKLEENISKLNMKRHSLVRNEDDINAEMRSYRTNKNSLSLFGSFMPELIKSIEQSNRKGEFHQFPRGPLGKYIEVTDEKFKGPVESIIGQKLLSFCVNDAKDREVLYRLFGKLSSKYPDVRKCPVITTEFSEQVYDVVKGKVKSFDNAYCVFDVIKSSDPVIMNTLIDHCKIERILITDDSPTGFSFTANTGNVPCNLSKVIVLSPPTEIFPTPNLRTYALKKQSPRYLQVDIKGRKQCLMDEIRVIKDHLKEVNGQIQVDESKKKEFVKTIQEKRSFGDTLEDTLVTVTQKINRLQKIEYPGDNEREMLEDELKELRHSHNELEKEQTSVKQRADELEAALNLKLISMRNVDENIDITTAKIDQTQIEIDVEQNFSVEQTANFNANQRNAAKIKENVEKLQAEEQSYKTKIQALTITANNHGERIPIKNSHDFLTSKIQETEKIIKTVKASKNSLEDVEQALLLKSAEYDEKKELVENLEKTVEKLRNSRKIRCKWLVNFKSFMSLCVQKKFKDIIKLHQFDGSLTIDHEKELLELSVVPRDQHIANSVSSAKCLSGGERSFTTVAFLIALWSVVDSPFFFLDEYDVYTDTVNRCYMAKLLLGEAQKKLHRQYTFLTPRDMPEITASKNMSIQSLPDPVRK